jgi:peroxiredoxin
MTELLSQVASRPPMRLGEHPPSFEDLPGTDGRHYSLSTFESARALVVVFNANRCPTAKAYEDRMVGLQDEFAAEGVQLVAINSTNPHLYAEERFSAMVEHARDAGYNFPYLKDEDQSVAKGFGAQCTLHAFLLDQDRRLRYRGRIDNSRDPRKVTQHDVRNALLEVLAGKGVTVPETEPFGCSLDLG